MEVSPQYITCWYTYLCKYLHAVNFKCTCISIYIDMRMNIRLPWQPWTFFPTKNKLLNTTLHSHACRGVFFKRGLPLLFWLKYGLAVGKKLCGTYQINEVGMQQKYSSRALVFQILTILSTCLKLSLPKTDKQRSLTWKLSKLSQILFTPRAFS